MTYHLAPPILGGKEVEGRPAKREFGAWMERGFRMLARLKVLRGTPFDPFGRNAERKMERALIKQYEGDLAEVFDKVKPETMDAALALAALPLEIRGYGPVKVAAEAKAAKRREELLSVIRNGGAPMARAAE